MPYFNALREIADGIAEEGKQFGEELRSLLEKRIGAAGKCAEQFEAHLELFVEEAWPRDLKAYRIYHTAALLETPRLLPTRQEGALRRKLEEAIEDYAYRDEGEVEEERADLREEMRAGLASLCDS